MGLIKTNTGSAVLHDNGSISIEAAIAKQDKPKAPAAYKQRDFDAEARGKTRCALFAAALQSPSLAGLQFGDTAEGFIEVCKKVADAGVAYSFQD